MSLALGNRRGLRKATRPTACRRSYQRRRGLAAGARGWVLAAVALLAVGSTADAQVAIRSDTAPPVQAGGQVRQQYERFENEEWGSETPDDTGYWLQRYMLHLDARLSRKIRAYAELKSAIEVGRTGGPRLPDEDKLDLHQGFVDVSLGAATIRLGRQELAFGSQRLVSVREGPNVRQTFDGASVIVERGRWRVVGFGAKYVATERGVFDDSSDTGRSLWGVYAVRRTGVADTGGVDIYYLGYRRNEATFDQGLGRELRHSWGARYWRTAQRLDYNFEGVLQAGTFGDSRILAWTLASDTGYWPNAATRLGVRADITSGDADRSDDRLGTFNPLFPKGAYLRTDRVGGPVEPHGCTSLRDASPAL